jgi:serine protease inhibitor ecotin
MDGLLHGKSEEKMDENWGYPYFRKPKNQGSIAKMESKRVACSDQLYLEPAYGEPPPFHCYPLVI